MKPIDLRGILKYVPQYRGKTFVIALDSVITESENFSNILLDVAVLCSLNIHVVLVHGISSLIAKIAIRAAAGQSPTSDIELDPVALHSFTPSDLDGSGITDEQTLKVALMAANRCTHEILEGLTTADLRAVTCNGIIAYPMGIICGVDHQFTGKVERVDVEMFQTLLNEGIIPVAPPLGFDGEGNTYRVNSDNIACALGVHLKAQKIVFVSSMDGLYCNDKVIGNIQAQDLQTKLSNPSSNIFLPKQISKAQHAVQACLQGVPRVHLINGLVNESLITEVFSNEGVGTLIYANEYQQIRQAGRKDIRTIFVLIKQGVETEELVARTYKDIEAWIENYYLFEIDGHAVACVALHVYPDRTGELACLFVTCTHENKGIGHKLVSFIEEKARKLKLKKLLVLSTQTYTYFKMKCGFMDGDESDLYPDRLEQYKKSQRRSKILVKYLKSKKSE